MNIICQKCCLSSSKAQISESMVQTNLITAFKQMGKYIAFKRYLRGGPSQEFGSFSQIRIIMLFVLSSGTKQKSAHVLCK